MDKRNWFIGGALGLTALALLWWQAPQGTSGGGVEPEPAPAAQLPKGPREIALSPDQIDALSLRFAASAPAEEAPLATLPAVIVPPPNARVAVAAQLPGTVTRIFVIEGDQVRAGQRLATISSRDMVMLGAELARARARLDVARANAARLAQLSKEGIIAPARADEAQAQLRQAQVDVSEQARLIGMANGSGGETGYTLTAPISGRVSMLNIETGQAIDPGAAPFVIDAVGSMMAQAQLPERLLGTVRRGMTVRAGRAEGKVQAVGSTLDPASRSARLTASLPADAGLHAGQSLSLLMMGPAPAGSVRVPSGAVTGISGTDTVFVRTAKGVAPRPVTLAQDGESADGGRIILSGLKAGEQVAISALSELKALAAAD